MIIYTNKLNYINMSTRTKLYVTAIILAAAIISMIVFKSTAEESTGDAMRTSSNPLAISIHPTLILR